MTRNRVEWIVSAIVGLAAGIGLWFVSGVILMMMGFSFYAVIAAAFLALLIWLVAAPLLYLRIRRRHPPAKYRLVPLLAGMLIMIVYFVIAVVITHPRAILPG